jgi:hypothetical protein
MKTQHQKGFVHILLIAFLVLFALSTLARCDIDNASADEVTPYLEPSDAIPTPTHR